MTDGSVVAGIGIVVVMFKFLLWCLCASRRDSADPDERRREYLRRLAYSRRLASTRELQATASNQHSYQTETAPPLLQNNPAEEEDNPPEEGNNLPTSNYNPTVKEYGPPEGKYNPYSKVQPIAV